MRMRIAQKTKVKLGKIRLASAPKVKIRSEARVLEQAIKKIRITRKFSTSTLAIFPKAKPFLQWVGGKREMIPQCEQLLPKKIERYFEPFLGGGAMFFHLRDRIKKEAILSDSNPELIRTYRGVRDNVDRVIGLLAEMKVRHSPELYGAIRGLDRERDILGAGFSDAEVAARMVYLNQTCFNGVYRVNSKGQFNVPIGSSLNRGICDEGTLRAASVALKEATIESQDFLVALRSARRGDFVYLDPPYFPVSKYSDFNRYTKEKFYPEDQVALKQEVDRLTERGVSVMVSNSDCAAVRKLYAGYTLRKIFSSRLLNSKVSRRGKVAELVITNY